MAQALRLAARGMETCRPNPRVGCVIAQDQEVVGRGWHERAGQEHAEIAALAEADGRARGATAYVTLEPCAHHGKTGPCTEALIEAGIKEVVAATRDPNPRVNGSGLEQLRDAGIAVREGLMQAAAEDLNAGFFSRLKRNRPWVRVKLAHSVDGRTALSNGQSQWISSAASRTDVQRWRARSCAILTGMGTLLSDDPSLNVREEAAIQPLRVILDSRWNTPPQSKTLALTGQVMIAGRDDLPIPTALSRSGAELLQLPAAGEKVDLGMLLEALAEREINEVQVEAGATLCGALLSAGYIDEILLYCAPCLLGAGAQGMFLLDDLQDMSDRVSLKWLDAERIGPDLRMRMRPVYGEDTCLQAS